jgi:hypothetical protein
MGRTLGTDTERRGAGLMTARGRRIGLGAAAVLAALTLVTAGVALHPGAARASVVLALSLEDLIRRADLVVVAVATEEQSRRQN